MKKTFFIFLLLSSLTMFGCGIADGLPMRGGVFVTNMRSPLLVTDNPNQYTKVGTAKISTIFGLIVVGDASIETACKNAGITKIHHIDQQFSASLFGLGRTYTVYVYGD